MWKVGNLHLGVVNEYTEPGENRIQVTSWLTVHTYYHCPHCPTLMNWLGFPGVKSVPGNGEELVFQPERLPPAASLIAAGSSFPPAIWL